MPSNTNQLRIPYNDWFAPIARFLKHGSSALGLLACTLFIASRCLKHTSFKYMDFLLVALGLPTDSSTASHLLSSIVYLAIIAGIPCSFLPFAIGQQALVISEDWLYFPITFAATLLNRRQRLWSDVANISVRNGESHSRGQLIMWFKSGGKAVIHLDCIPANQIEELALSIEIRAQIDSPDLDALLDILHNKTLTSGGLSFTQLWEKDMNYKFRSVAFVPLAPGETIKNGELKIERQLSFGGLSAVYLVRTSGNQPFVLKEVSLPANSNSQACSKAELLLRREAASLQKLCHPQIVKIKDVFDEH